MHGHKTHLAQNGRPLTLDEVFSLIADPLDQTRRRIGQILQSGHTALDLRIQSITGHPGKMIRPAVLLLSAGVCGKTDRQAIEMAAIVEIIHAATLLHDDVIDGAELRRAQPSANAQWGNVTAVLMGDYLLGRALKAGAILENRRAVKLMTEAADAVCRGELMQNLRRADWDMTEGEYLEIIDLKTASLFRCCAELGAITAEADPEQIQALGRFGGLLGQAFQISDDLLDILGSEQRAGKTLGTDLAGCKPTLPVIDWLQSLNPVQRQEIVDKLKTESDKTRMPDRIRSADTIQQTRQKMTDLVQRALRSLEPVGPSEFKNALITLGRYVADRV